MVFKIGQNVRIKKGNENNSYESIKNKILVVSDVSTNSDEHPGYDDNMKGQALYNLKDIKTGKYIQFSLYDNELESI